MLCVCAGVSGKGSLAKERNSLGRETRACFLPRVPHAVGKTLQKEKADGESPGWECLVAKLSCWRSEVVRKAAEGNLASLLDFLCCSRLTFLCYLVMFSCFLSQTPTSYPSPNPRHSRDGSWASPRTPRSTPHSPSGLAPQASSSPSSIFQESLLHSPTHSLSHPNPPPQACSKTRVCNSTGPVGEAAPSPPPPLHTPSGLVSGRVLSPRGMGTASRLPGPASHSGPIRPGCKSDLGDNRRLAPTLLFPLNPSTHALSQK